MTARHTDSILHVSWEYPPLVYGGLGRHVHALAEAQAALGHDVTVLTQSVAGAPDDAVVNGVRVVRVPHDPPELPFDEEHLLAWVASLESAMTRRAASLVDEPGIVHAHDWMVAHAAVAIRDFFPGSALIATIHATEAGRHQGWLPTPLSEAIHSVEEWLLHQADCAIVCSHHMRWEVERLHPAAAGTLEVVANGIDLRSWQAPARDVALARDRFAATGPLVVYCGRLEWEKGVHTLVDAVPRLRRRLPGLRVVIAGRGGATDDLMRQARDRRVASAITFTGWISERDLRALIASADALVVPSIYEPFGLVALEGAALGAPLVVARSGGLAEFVRDGVTGRTFAPGEAADLARAVTEAVTEAPVSRDMAATARQVLEKSYQWELLAAETDRAYERAHAMPGPRSHASPTTPPRGVNLLRDSS